jgi:AraC-like DNA-binding protein
MSRTRQAGKDVRSLAYDYPSGHRIPPHRHAEHQLVYATGGVMIVHTPEGSWVVPPHRGVWVPAGVEHAIEISGPVAMRTLYILPGVARSLVDRDACGVLAVPGLLRELILHVVTLGGLDRRVAAEGRLLAVLLDLLELRSSASLCLPEPRDPRAVRIAALLLRDPSGREPLSRVLPRGASRRTIERLFRAETGMSLGRWRQQRRLVHALKLLASGAAVTSVAFDVGYDSPSAFVAAFRRTFGTTPGRYFQSAAGSSIPRQEMT